MARFRRRARRAYAAVRGIAKRGYRAARKEGSATNVLLGGAIYGALRDKAASYILPYIPAVAGEYTDELAMGAVSYLLATKTGGMLRSVGKAGLTIEAARLGAGLAAGVLGGSANTSSANVQVYG